MKLWLDGQCLQDAHRRVTYGFRAVDLLKRLLQADGGIDLHISLDAQWLDEAAAARRYLDKHLPTANVQIWQSVPDAFFSTKVHSRGGGDLMRLGVVSREAPGHRLSRLALTHHINCLAPDIALFPGSSEENCNADECLVDSESKIFILPELSKLFCVSVGMFHNKNFDFEFDNLSLQNITEHIEDNYHRKFVAKFRRLNQEQIINLSRNSLKDNVSYGYSSDKIVSKLMAFSEPLQPKETLENQVPGQA